MVASGREHGVAHLAHLQREDHPFEVGQRLSLREPGEFAAIDGRGLVFAQATRKVGEVGTVFQCLGDGVDTRLGLLLVFVSGFLAHHQQDVRGFDHTAHRVDAMLCLAIDALRLGLHIVVGDEGRADLLVAIRRELLLERGQRVHAGIFRGLHLQLVVDEEIDIVGHVFLVDDALGVVFVVRILKFRAQHGLSVHGHNDGIVLRLRIGCRCCEEQGGEKHFFHYSFDLQFSNLQCTIDLTISTRASNSSVPRS